MQELSDTTPRQPVRGGAIIHAMAQAMLEIGEGCTDRDLLASGFSRTDIDRHSAEAATRAGRRARLN